MRNSKWKWSKSTTTDHIQLKHNGAICRRPHQALHKSTVNKSQITPFDVDFIVDQKKYNICNTQSSVFHVDPFERINHEAGTNTSRHKYPKPALRHTVCDVTRYVTSHGMWRHTVWATDKWNKRFYDNQWVTQLWTSQRCYKCHFCHHTMVKLV